MTKKTTTTFAEALAQEKEMEKADGITRAEAAGEKTTKEPKEKAPPRAKIPTGATPSQTLAIHLGSTEAVHGAIKLHRGDTVDEAYANNVFGVIDKLAKKVAEKAVNLIRYRSAPDNIQGYTRKGLDLLISQGEVTSKQMVDMMRAAKYTDGTSRAQSNQLFQLFPALGIAERGDKSTMKLVKGSAIVSDYRKATGL